jgi:hypothetical protein
MMREGRPAALVPEDDLLLEAKVAPDTLGHFLSHIAARASQAARTRYAATYGEFSCPRRFRSTWPRRALATPSSPQRVGVLHAPRYPQGDLPPDANTPAGFQAKAANGSATRDERNGCTRLEEQGLQVAEVWGIAKPLR